MQRDHFRQRSSSIKRELWLVEKLPQVQTSCNLQGPWLVRHAIGLVGFLIGDVTRIARRGVIGSPSRLFKTKVVGSAGRSTRQVAEERQCADLQES
jgi:hypothetical protein